MKIKFTVREPATEEQEAQTSAEFQQLLTERLNADGKIPHTDDACLILDHLFNEAFEKIMGYSIDKTVTFSIVEEEEIRCPEYESGGYQCELNQGHTGNHFISDETIRKAIHDHLSYKNNL